MLCKLKHPATVRSVCLSYCILLAGPMLQAMELTGSEYWTYFLPRRVGKEAAAELTNNTRPITANQALGLGMVDDLLRYSPSATYHQEVRMC